MTELRMIHSRNKMLNQKGNKINNLKRIFANKGKSRNSFFDDFKENKKPKNQKYILPKFHTFNFRYLQPKIPIKLSLYTILAMKKNNEYEKYEKTNLNESNKTINFYGKPNTLLIYIHLI